MKDNNILSVNQMYTFEVAKNMQRLALKDVPNSFLSIFDPQFRIPNMSLRSTSNYLPAPSSSDKAQQCIRFTGPKIWNKLPVHIRKNIHENENIDEANFFPNKRFALNMRQYVPNQIDFI